jgi:hypothetical protein
VTRFAIVEVGVGLSSLVVRTWLGVPYTLALHWGPETIASGTAAGEAGRASSFPFLDSLGWMLRGGREYFRRDRVLMLIIFAAVAMC